MSGEGTPGEEPSVLFDIGGEPLDVRLHEAAGQVAVAPLEGGDQVEVLGEGVAGAVAEADRQYPDHAHMVVDAGGRLLQALVAAEFEDKLVKQHVRVRVLVHAL